MFATHHGPHGRATGVDLSGVGGETERDEQMMRLAIALAREARNQGEVPVGAVVARRGVVIAQAHNLRETLHDPTAHAERLALAWAGQAIGSWRLDECVLYVTLEPLRTCCGAIVLSRIARLVYGATDPKAGACEACTDWSRTRGSTIRPASPPASWPPNAAKSSPNSSRNGAVFVRSRRSSEPGSAAVVSRRGA